MTGIPTTCFGQAATAPRLPPGPILELPAGDAGVTNRGSVFFHGRWIMAVAISDEVVLVVQNCPERRVPLALREQLTGYLACLGCQVLRVRIRFPLEWHNPGNLVATLVFWAERFLDGLTISLEADLSRARPRLALPVDILARYARREWEQVWAVWSAFGSMYPGLLPQISSLLAIVVRRWELHWALQLRDAEKRDDVTRLDRAEVEACDRTLASIVRLYAEPFGYRMLPPTTMRLL